MKNAHKKPIIKMRKIAYPLRGENGFIGGWKEVDVMVIGYRPSRRLKYGLRMIEAGAK